MLKKRELPVDKLWGCGSWFGDEWCCGGRGRLASTGGRAKNPHVVPWCPPFDGPQGSVKGVAVLDNGMNLKRKESRKRHIALCKTMPWTQVYVTGLSETIEPSDEELERMLDVTYNFSSAATNTNNEVLWAGPGSTLVKRDKHTGACRGYAFLAFFSSHGAEIIVDRINSKSFLDPTDDDNTTATRTGLLPPLLLRAELSKAKKEKPKKNQGAGTDYSDLRLRRKRGAPVRKHPVIVSSDKTKTGLGNKTK